jgi:cell division septation protein DedD
MRGTTTAISAATGVIVLSLAASAPAATVTYTSGDVPKTVDDGQSVTSSVTVPSGRTAAIDVDVVGLNVLSPTGSGDRNLLLRAPNGGTAGIVPGSCDTIADTGMIVDDEAPSAFSCQPPALSSMRPGGTPLSSLDGPSAGTWTMTFGDAGGPPAADPGTLSTWSVRVTHAPFLFTVLAKGQELRPKIKVRATCNAKCSIKSSGDVKARKVKLAQNVSSKLRLPLKPEAFSRLAAGGGTARFTLLAKDGYGDRFTQNVKITFPG